MGLWANRKRDWVGFGACYLAVGNDLAVGRREPQYLLIPPPLKKGVAMQLRVKPTPITVRPAPPTHGIPTLKYARQQEDRWCWAACVEIILKHYCLPPDDQCKIAEKGLKI